MKLLHSVTRMVSLFIIASDFRRLATFGNDMPSFIPDEGAGSEETRIKASAAFSRA